MNRCTWLALILSLASAAGAQTVSTVVNNGPPSELYDIVILGDGYQASEQASFDRDVQDVVNFMRTHARSFPFGEYFQLYNVHSVFRASRQSGADKPPINFFVDTAYDGSYWTGNIERCLYIHNGSLAAADAALAPDTDGRVVVLVNDSKYGGCAGTWSVSYNGSSMENVQIHEWGHSFAGLADEYNYGNSGSYSGPEPGQPNITADSTGQAKWPLWLGHAGPTSTVGAYEGAGYYPRGLFRPETNCQMRALGQYFCTICREAIIKRFHRETAVLGDPQPIGNPVPVATGAQQRFSITNRVANRPHAIEWFLDGIPQQSGGTSWTWDTTGVSGLHTVRVRLTDTSAEVRSDPTNYLVHEHTWNADISACGQLVTYYGSGCAGSNRWIPMIQIVGQPRIPSTSLLRLVNGPAFQRLALLVGLSDQQLPGGVALPFDLTPLGMPGCQLLTSAEIPLPASSDSSGTSQLFLTVPNDPLMSGGRLFMQWLCLDPGVNAFGATTSNAVALTICL